jgi:hypothetical protein
MLRSPETQKELKNYIQLQLVAVVVCCVLAAVFANVFFEENCNLLNYFNRRGELI